MDALKQLIEELSREATQMKVPGRTLTPKETARAEAISRAVPLLQEAQSILSAEVQANPNLITYKIVSDSSGKLKQGARIACNFWNRFIAPNSSVVIRLGVFTEQSATIAQAYEPYRRGGVVYGVVEFNTKYLSGYTDNEVAGTIIHEVGHTLGFGWDAWMDLFDPQTGRFTEAAIGQLAALKDMRVETDYGPGTEYSHWDEQKFDKELMTGIQDRSEHVLPVTIDVMKLLGHSVIEKLQAKTKLDKLLSDVKDATFLRRSVAKSMDLDHFEETTIWENIPHRQPIASHRK